MYVHQTSGYPHICEANIGRSERNRLLIKVIQYIPLSKIHGTLRQKINTLNNTTHLPNKQIHFPSNNSILLKYIETTQNRSC